MVDVVRHSLTYYFADSIELLSVGFLETVSTRRWYRIGGAQRVQ